jgi:hypothetical protein
MGELLPLVVGVRPGGTYWCCKGLTLQHKHNSCWGEAWRWAEAAQQAHPG